MISSMDVDDFGVALRLRAHDGFDAAGVMQRAFQFAAVFQHNVPKPSLDALASY